MLNDLNFGVKQKFNIKCMVDVVIFVVIVSLFVSYSLKYGNNPYESVLYMTIMIILFVAAHLFTKQWVNRAIRKSLTKQSESVSQAAKDVMETLSSQKGILESLIVNFKEYW